MNVPLSSLLRRLGGLAAAAALALLFTTMPARAQQGAIAGTVTEAQSGQPLQGAQVFIEGTEFGTLTGQDGGYRITGVPTGTYEVRVRLIGYMRGTSQVEVQAGQTVSQDFALEISAIALDELVTTFTGQQRRRQVGASISEVNVAEDVVEKSAPSNLTDILKGRSPGVSIQRASGTVGTGATIKVRGLTSFSDNTPLIFVDGAAVNTSNDISSGQSGQSFTRLNDLDPSNIESIEVLKGPAATALYGTGAANGVIVINTKQGRVGEAQYNFRVTSGFNEKGGEEFPTTGVNLTSPALLGDLAKDTVYTLNLLEDPQLEPFERGLIQEYFGSVRGGIENISYYVSGSYKDEEGILPQNEAVNFNGRANFSINPSEKVDVNVSTGYMSGQNNLPQNDNNGFGFVGIAQIAFPWNVPITRADPTTGEGSFQTCPLFFELARGTGTPLSAFEGACPDNPFFAGRTFEDVATISASRDPERFTGSGSVNYRPIPEWSNRLTIGYDVFSEEFDNLIPVNPDLPFGSFSEGNKFTETTQNRNITVEFNSSVDLAFGEDWTSQTTGGVQWFRNVVESSSCDGQTLPAGTITCGNAVVVSGDEFFFEQRNFGVFVQEQLGYRDRLFLTPSLRADDNAAFGEELGVQWSPGMQVSYAVGEEDFAPEFLSELRLRGSYGQSTQQPGPLDALRLLEATRVTFQGGDFAGVSVTDPGNQELKPASVEEFEGGFDLGLMNGRVGLEATYYHQNTNDAIVFRDLAPSLGFPGASPVNVGQLRNRGVEVSLDALAVDMEDVTWSWNVNATTIESDITELDQPIIFGLGGSSQRHASPDSVTGETFAPGSYFTEPVFINEQGEVEVGETQFLGQPTPELEGSISTTVTLFDRLTFSALLDYALGHQLFNSTEEFQCGFLGGGVNGGICLDIFERGPDGELTDEARIKAEAARVGSEAPWIEDADYGKLRSVSARFEFPQEWTQSFGASAASITLIGENLATFTGYSGTDPEINFGGQSDFTRAEFLTLPIQRRFLAKLSVQF